MAPLLTILGVLLGLAGALKLRAGARLALGTHPLTTLELVAGGALFVAAFFGVSGGLGFALALGGLVLMVAASFRHVRDLNGRVERRRATEGRRLATFLGGTGSGDLDSWHRPEPTGTPGDRSG